MPFFPNKTLTVQYVADRLQALKPDSQLTMTIIPVRSVGFSVTTATSLLSVARGKRRRGSYKRRITISTENTSDG